MPSRLRDELVTTSGHVWGRLNDRLNGLTDHEYLSEPVPGSWTVRPGPDGRYAMDYVWPPPDPSPVTTISWRLAHVVTDDRFRPWLGLAPDPARQRPVPATATEARAAVEAAQADMRDDLMEITDDDLWAKIGSIGGPFGDATRAAWVLHVLEEVTHHGAEVGLLRDLYRAGLGR
jgi:DinB superfamily